MPVNLSIRNVPDEIADKLRARAERNHRSLQGELMAVIERATGAGELHDEGRKFVSDPQRTLSPREALKQMRGLGVRTKDEAVQMIREDRDR